MPLPSSGSISLSQVNTELGFASSASIQMGGSGVRGLFGIASGSISMGNGYGKSAQYVFTKTITANTLNYNLRNDMVANGYSGSGAFTADLTVATGVYVWSDSTSLPGFNTGALSGGTVNITNNGFILGKGGAGGGSTTGLANVSGLAGGPAIVISTAVNITNNSYIGGGGGGAGSYFVNNSGGGGTGGGGGGAGGGAGGPGWANNMSGSGVVSGGAGGSVGSSGGNSTVVANNYSGAGGGRIFPGVGGAMNVGGGSGGGGGMARSFTNQYRTGAAGAAGGGGGWGAAGGKGGLGISGAAGGSAGDVGGTGGSGSSTAVGGAGGNAVVLNGYSVTWISTGTRYGAIS